MNPLSHMGFIMDGVAPEEMEQVAQRIKAMDRDAVETFLTLLDMRFVDIQSERNVPTEYIQRQEGRKDELKDLKDSIMQALQPAVNVTDDESIPGIEGVSP